MSRFCQERIAPDPAARAEHGVWRGADAAPLYDARARARAIVAGAHDEARDIAARAAAAGRAEAERVEAEALRRAAELIAAIEARHTAFLAEGGAIAVDLAQQMFARLTGALTPRERVEALLRRLLAEAPRRLVGAVLHVHPDELALLPPAGWDVQADAALQRGTCRLEAAQGEWRIDFSAAVAALQEALAAAAGADHSPQPECSS